MASRRLEVIESQPYSKKENNPLPEKNFKCLVLFPLILQFLLKISEVRKGPLCFSINY